MRRLGILLVGAILATALSGIPVAAASPAIDGGKPMPLMTSSAGPSPGSDCQIVLAPLQPGERHSRVLSQQCASPGHRLVAPRATVLIMTWYEHIRYGGASTRIYGVYGPCDSAGYGIRGFDEFWDNKVSSFKVWNSCTYTRGYLEKNYGGTNCGRWRGSVDWVGHTYNDKLSSFWVTSVSRPCE